MHLKLLIPLLALTACRAPSPLPPQPDFDPASRSTPAPEEFSSEGDLLDRWKPGGALQTFWEGGEPGTFEGVDGATLAYRVFRTPDAKAAVVVLPGRTEAIIKYAEVAQDLVDQGYSAYLLTLRGQGEASRLLPDPEKGHVVWFDDYVADTHTFIDTVVKPEEPRIFLLSHSTGGAVAALLADQHPDDVEAQAMSSPMLEINYGAFPPAVAASLAFGVCDASDGTDYSIGGGPWTDSTTFDPATDSVTQSEARWTWKTQQLRDDPSIRLGSATWRWVCQASEGSSRASQLGRYSSTPTLLLQAAKDQIVKPEGQEIYCADAPACTLLVLDDAKHELLQERDATRNLALSMVVKFFDAQVAP